VFLYSDTGYIKMDINTTVGAAAINMATGIGSEYDHPAMYAWSPNAGTTAEYEELAILGPASTYDEKQPSIVLTGSAKDGSSLAGTTVNTYDGFTINRSLDGNSYPWTRAWKEASATTINSTTPIPVSGLSFNVAARTYKVSGRIYGQAAASGVPQPGSIRFGGTATASGLSIDVQMIEYGEGETANIGWIDALDQDPSAIAGAWPNNAEYSIRFEGIAAFSAPGTFDVLGRVTSSSSDASWSTTDFSYMIIEPL
jgi:hypothetical protein